MADLCLFAAFASITVYTPKHKLTRVPTTTLYATLGCSLALLSLAVLEVTPASWNVFIEHYKSSSNSSKTVHDHEAEWIISAYRALLLAISIIALVVIPSTIGGTLFNGVPSLLFTSNTTGEYDNNKNTSTTSTDRIDTSKFAAVTNLLRTAFFYTIVSPTLYVIRWLRVLPCCAKSKCDQLPTLSPTSEEQSRFMRILTNDSKLCASSVLPRRRVLVGSTLCVLVTWIVSDSLGTWLMALDKNSSNSNDVTVANSASATLGQFILSTCLPLAVSWLCAVGVLLSSLINGFGSASLPFECLSGLFLMPVPAHAVSHAHKDLDNARESLKNRQEELEQLEEQCIINISSMNNKNNSSGGNILQPIPASSSNNLTRFFGGSSSTAPISSQQSTQQQQLQRKLILQNEIKFLSVLVQELEDDVQMMEQSRQRSHKARTSTGKIRSYVGLVFSVILSIRLAFALFVVEFAAWTGDDGTASAKKYDPVTTALIWLLGHNYISVRDHHDYEAMSQFISLAITAILSMTQIRTLLHIIASANRRLTRLMNQCQPSCISMPTSSSNNSNNSSSVKDSNTETVLQSLTRLLEKVYVHAIAFAIACYSVASLVLTKVLLPPVYQVAWSKALGASLTVRPAPSQSVFGMTAVLSIIVLGMVLGLERQQSRRYAEAAAASSSSTKNTAISSGNSILMMEP